jgi:hypothetical protein
MCKRDAYAPPLSKNMLPYFAETPKFVFGGFHSDQPLTWSFITTGSRRIFSFPA